MNTNQKQQPLESTESTRSTRSAFTLVELLMVLSIIGVLSAVVMGAIRAANQDTLVAKTRGTIAKIDSILNDRYDEYLTASMSFVIPNAADALPPLVPNNFRSHFPNEVLTGTQTVTRVDNAVPLSLLRERVRLATTRDLMRMEMPDCPGDLADLTRSPPIRLGANIFTGLQSSLNGFLYLRAQSAGRFDRILQRVSLGRDNTGAVNPIIWARENPNAELLYLIIEDSTLNGSSAIEAFGNSEIADTDNDGLMELIDAWGNPIRWLRCPSGINSTARFDPDPLHPSGTQPSDPFDPTKADVGFDIINFGNPINLPSVGQRPLVVSAGVDGRFGIRFFGVTTSNVASHLFSTSAVVLTNATFPRRPLYGGSVTFEWPDPFYPRKFLPDPPALQVDLRLGAVLDDSVDTISDPIGVDYSASPAVLIPNRNSVDTNYRLHAEDNVTNLDESGASL